MFLALAIVCDEFFVTSLEKICEVGTSQSIHVEIDRIAESHVHSVVSFRLFTLLPAEASHE